MSEVKVSSRVRIVDKKPADYSTGPGWDDKCMDPLLGTIGVVVRRDHDGYWEVKFPNGSIWTYKVAWFTVIEEETTKATPDVWDPNAQLAAAKRRLDENLRKIFCGE